MTHATDIVAYTYNADIWCPDCIRRAFALHVAEQHATTDVEALLDRVASGRGINRYDERSFDSGDFPKVIFADSVWNSEDREYCGQCHEEIEP